MTVATVKETTELKLEILNFQHQLSPLKPKNLSELTSEVLMYKLYMKAKKIQDQKKR